MKKQLLFLSLAAAAMLAGCSKNEPGVSGGGTADAAVEICAKAVGAGSIDSKAPIAGSTLDGKQADVYTTVSPLHTYVGDKTKMFTDAYTRGTMTFNDAKYVGYDAGFAGNSLLPQDGTVRYLTAFYPAGWTRAADATNTFETLSFTFDGSHDVMTSWMTGNQDVQVKHNDATLPERGDFTFKHLLMRCDVQVQAKDANAVSSWGNVKSVKIKGAVNNTVNTDASLGYNYTVGGGAVSFFKMEGTDMARTYSDAAFEQAALADMLHLTVDVQNACYSMLAPVAVDADSKTAELTLVVVTRDKEDADGGKEVTTEVPVSLDQTKFTDPLHNTRGYAVTVQLNFRAGAIQAIASVEEWKDGGSQNEDVDGTTPVVPKIGDLKDGGIVYEVNGSKVKVLSLDEGTNLQWAAQSTYEIGTAGQSDTDGKANVAAIKAYFAANTATVGSDFSVAFPAANFCESKNTGGVTGWYLPAKNELVALYNAYTTNKTAIDAGIANNSGTAISASGNFWSSTENSNYGPSYAWYVFFSFGNTSVNDKGGNNYVRCVREL